MQAELAWADKADYLIALFGAEAVAALLARIADAVRLCDDVEVGRLDRILQHVEKRLQEPWRISSAAISRGSRRDGKAEPLLELMVA